MQTRSSGAEITTGSGEGRGVWLMLAALVLCAGAVYLGGITKNLPYAPETDEPDIVNRAVGMVAYRTLNPGWFGHPGSTLLYSLALFYEIAYGPGAVALLETDLGALYLPARTLTALYGVGAVVLVFLCGRRVFGARAALVGAGLFIFYPLAVAHFQMVRSDSAGTLFLWASLCQLVRLYDRPRLGNVALAGTLIGLGISSRYFLVTLLFPLALVVWLRVRPASGTRAALGAVVAGGLVALVAFALSTPYFFVELPTALANLRVEARSSHVGADGLTPPQNALYYLFTAIPAALTAPQAIAAAAGIALAVWRRHTLALVLVTTALVFIAAISLSALHWPRWIIPVLPVFSLHAGHALVQGVDRLLARPAQRTAAAVLAVLAIAAVPMSETVLHTLRESRPSTRVLAREWMLAHVPPGSTVKQEWYAALLAGTPFETSETFSLAGKPSPCNYYDEGVAYLVTSSNISDRYYREPDRYAAEIAFYQQLRDPAYAMHEIAPSRTTGGPTVRIYALRACSVAQ